jgi:hypothetical protein
MEFYYLCLGEIMEVYPVTHVFLVYLLKALNTLPIVHATWTVMLEYFDYTLGHFRVI